jgi:HEAT repeat protein
VLALLTLESFCLLASNVWAQSTDAKIETQIQRLKDEDPISRDNAAIDLGDFGPRAKEAVPALITALKDNDRLVRGQSAVALGEIGPEAKAAAPALIAALSDPSADIRMNAAEALGHIGPVTKEVVPALIKLLNDRAMEVRISAFETLGNIGPTAKQAIPALMRSLKDPIPRVREMAGNALGRIAPGAKEVLAAVIIGLRDPDTNVRFETARTLEEFGPDADEVPALVATLNDPAADVRNASANALASFAEAARDQLRTDLIPTVDEAAKALEAGGQIRQAKRVRTALQYLRAIQPPWYQRLFGEFSRHPWVTGAAAVYLGLFTISLLLLWLYPLALLRISEVLAVISVAPQVDKIVGVGEAVFVFALFRHHPRVLDAWVAKYLDRTREQFQSIATVQQREVHVSEVPVELDRKVLPGLGAKDLESAFSGKSTRLLIWGEGGSGKTSLACQIARSVMSESDIARPCGRPMLPVLIEEDLKLEVGKDKSALTEEIRGRLRELTGVAKAPSLELVRHLLQRKRVLLIVDGLSELNEGTRSRVRPIDPEFDTNALIVTSRLEEDLDGVTKTVIRPHRIDGNRLSSFMEAYFNRCGKRGLFDDAEFFEGCKRLSRLVVDRNTTVLLAKLYAEQMIAAKEKQASERLPESIPDLMLEYINRINRRVSGMDDRTLHAAAKAIAWECLRQGFRPMPARVDDVVKALGVNAQSTLDYMEFNLRLLETIGAGRDRIRFALDPLAEYMAAFQVLETYGNDEDAWREFLAHADAIPGAPESIKGFLLAVRDCCQSKKGTDLHVPEFVAEDLGKRCALPTESK